MFHSFIYDTDQIILYIKYQPIGRSVFESVFMCVFRLQKEEGKKTKETKAEIRMKERKTEALLQTKNSTMLQVRYSLFYSRL